MTGEVAKGEIMREVFQTQLQEVQVRLVEMAEDTVTIIEKATKAFTESNVALADEAIAISDQTGNKALALDELVIRILAKQSPVARDLRILVSALRISASLERMGALSGHIAAIARYRFPGSAVPATLISTFKEMGELDARVDELHRHIFDVVLADDWKENAMFTVDVTLASRYHERFADHVVDISAKVSYLTTGEWNETD